MVKSDEIKRVIQECIYKNFSEKCYILILELFEYIETFEIELYYNNSNIVSYILKHYRYKRQRFDTEKLILKILENKYLTQIEINYIVDGMFYGYSQNFIITIIKNNLQRIDIETVYQLALDCNFSLVFKYLLEDLKYVPKDITNSFNIFKSHINIKMVRYLSKRKDIQRHFKKTEKQLIKDFYEQYSN